MGQTEIEMGQVKSKWDKRNRNGTNEIKMGQTKSKWDKLKSKWDKLKSKWDKAKSKCDKRNQNAGTVPALAFRIWSGTNELV